MYIDKHLYGGSGHIKKFKISASFNFAGIPTRASTTSIGIRPATATDFSNTVGLALDTGIYSTSQGSLEGLVTVDVRADAIIKAKISGAATDNTALIELDNTVLSSGGTVITDGDVGSDDQTGGLVYCSRGANYSLSRTITTHTSNTSFTVTVPFPRPIAVGDRFIWAPYNEDGDGSSGADGAGKLQATTNLTQADGSVAVGDGGLISVVLVSFDETGSEPLYSNSFVYFIFADHVFGV